MLLELRPEVQPATTAAPGEMKPPLIDAGGDIREGTKRRAGAKEKLPRHDYPDAGELEADVLLRAVRQEVAEHDRRIEIHLLEPMTRGGRERPCGPLGSGSALSRLVASDTVLVPPDRRSELKRQIGIIAIKIEDAEAGSEFGVLPEERPDVVLAVTGAGVQRE